MKSYIFLVKIFRTFTRYWVVFVVSKNLLLLKTAYLKRDFQVLSQKIAFTITFEIGKAYLCEKKRKRRHQ